MGHQYPADVLLDVKTPGALRGRLLLPLGRLRRRRGVKPRDILYALGEIVTEPGLKFPQLATNLSAPATMKPSLGLAYKAL